MRKLILLSLCLVAVAAYSASEEAQERLPRDWYELPENGTVTRDDSFRFTTTGALADRAIERVMRTNSHALDAYTQDRTRDHGPKDWSLASMGLSLSLSVGGTLGVMVVKGDASAALTWERKHVAPRVTEDDGDGAADMTIRADSSSREVRAQLEPLIRAVIATGKVKDESAFRKSLLAISLDYQSLVRGITVDPGRGWIVSKLRLDMSVDVSGKVNPAISVGGGVALRFDWKPCQHRSAHYKPNPEIDRFIASVGSQLHELPLDALTPKGFHLGSMRFGIGVWGAGKFGVAKVGASVMGSICLRRTETVHPVLLPPDATLDKIPLIAPPDPRHLAYAAANGIAYKDGAYQIPRDLFKKGLEKASRIGSYFAERATRSNGKHWELTELSTMFDLSLGGSIVVVSLGATVALSLDFIKDGHS